MVFPVVMYGCEMEYKESWALKNWCFWTAVLEKTLESPLDCKEIQPVHPKGAQSWVFIGRTNVEAATTILWPPDEKEIPTHSSTLAWKIPWTEERGRLQSMGSQRIGLSDFTFTLMRRNDSFEKTLMLGKIEGGRRRGRQWMRWLDSIIDLMDMSLLNSGSWWWTGRPGVLHSWGRKESDTTEQLNWTESSLALFLTLEEFMHLN